MAHTTQPSDEVIQAVRSQIPQFKAFLGADNANHIGIAESFDVFALPAADIPKLANSPEQVSDLLQRLGEWHHQIHVNGAPLAYANSEFVASQQSWIVTSVSKSPIAKEMDEAIRLLDERYPSLEVKVQFVIIPALQIRVFLLHSSTLNEVMVVQSIFDEIQGLTVYSLAEFFVRISSLRTIVGVRV